MKSPKIAQYPTNKPQLLLKISPRFLGWFYKVVFVFNATVDAGDDLRTP
jgi:hypothetical protein